MKGSLIDAKVIQLNKKLHNTSISIASLNNIAMLVIMLFRNNSQVFKQWTFYLSTPLIFILAIIPLMISRVKGSAAALVVLLIGLLIRLETLRTIMKRSAMTLISILKTRRRSVLTSGFDGLFCHLFFNGRGDV